LAKKLLDTLYFFKQIEGIIMVSLSRPQGQNGQRDAYQ